MTDEEKAAQAKAEAAKKAADAAAKKEAESKSTEPEDKEEPEDKLDAKELLAHNQKLKKENAERRIAEKEWKADKERQAKALEILTGKPNATIDPLEQAKVAAESKLRRAILQGAVAMNASDAHDVKLLFQAMDLKDVEVDVDADTFDEDAVKTAIDGIRKAKPFLFKAANDTKTTQPTKTGKQPVKTENGQPAASGSAHRIAWNALKSEGRFADAQQYWDKHHTEILKDLKAG